MPLYKIEIEADPHKETVVFKIEADNIYKATAMAMRKAANSKDLPSEPESIRTFPIVLEQKQLF